MLKIRKKYDKKNGSASNLNLRKIIWIFIFGAFTGVFFETLYCLVVSQKFEIRWGVIYGPFNPVYGFGAILLTIVLHRFQHLRDLWIFFISGLLGGSFEYLWSLLQEHAVGTVCWDYNGTPFNFSGRTNLFYAFCWGILGVIWIKDIYPRVCVFLEKLPRRFSKILTIAFSIYMMLNMAISAIAVGRCTLRRHGVAPRTSIERFLDSYYNDSFLKKHYPNMRIPKNF